MGLAEIREKMNNPRVAVIVGAVFVIALGVIFWMLREPSRGSVGTPAPDVTAAYFIDLSNGKEIVQSINEIPPMSNAAGQLSIVRVTYLSPDGGKTRLVAYYEKYTPQAKQLLETLSPEDRQARATEIESGHLIATPNPRPTWFPIESEDGKKIKDALYQQHAGKTLTPINP